MPDSGSAVSPLAPAVLQAVDRRPIPAHIGAVVHAQVIELTDVTLLTTTPVVVNFATPIHREQQAAMLAAPADRDQC
jgi:hypothetical protein